MYTGKRYMPKCNSCGSFISDNYARVFGDNDGIVTDCRHCPTTRGRNTDEDSDEGDDQVVLLREVRGADADLSSGRTSSHEEGPSGREQSADHSSERGSSEQGSEERNINNDGAGAERDGLGLDFDSLRSVFMDDRE